MPRADSPLRVIDVWREAVVRLEQAAISEGKAAASILLAHVLGTQRQQLPLRYEDELSPASAGRFQELVARRARHEPLQYLLGSWPFADLTMVVTPGVLIPRPDTEDWLVQLVDFLRPLLGDREFVFADVGTGSGIIGLFLLRAFPAGRAWLTDISAIALTTASANVRGNQADESRLALLQGSFLSCFREHSLDVVVANPPYIPDDDMPMLMAEVRDYEPHVALAGGDDGLWAIRELLLDGLRVLKAGGFMAFEHGHDQREAISSQIPHGWEQVLAGKDLGGHDRFMVLRKHIQQPDSREDPQSTGSG
jgi:release factor glutamine methyltransferase